MLTIVILSVLIIAISIAFLAVRIIVRKDGQFTSMHISGNKAMRERGIHCVIDQDRKERKNQ